MKKFSVFNLILITVLLLPGGQVKAQSASVDYPVVDQPLSDFKLLNVDYYKKKTFEPGDAKGKWLILDFWNSGCTSCVQSFPKVNKLYQEFKDSIQFLLIGQNNKYNKNIKKNFDRFTQNLGFELPIAYDSVLFEKFKIASVPYVLIVDPQGIVYAITSSGSSLSSKNLRDLIELKNPFFTKKEFVFGTTTRRVAWKYGSKEDKIQQETFLYRSILSSYQGEEYEFSERIDENASQGFFKVTNMSLNSLYKFAYLGRVTWGPRDSIYFIHWPSAILETADSSRLLAEFNATSPLEKFNVSISVPKARANRSGLMKALQSDLQNYFGYSASVETRLMPCWVLTATDQARKKLKSSYPKYQGESGAAGIHAKHLPMELLFAEIRHYAPPPYVPVFDETGIIDPIDIDFDAAMIDLEDVKKALSKHGLILEKTNRLMKVLIIRDPKTSN